MQRRCCPLAKWGYSRDGKKGTPQIVYGLLCAPDGCSVAIEVFDGNTVDPTTLAPKLKRRFKLDRSSRCSISVTCLRFVRGFS
jgi:transposase